MTEFQEILQKIIDAAEVGRPGYKDSLGKGASQREISQMLSSLFEELQAIPEIYFEIYELISGTQRGIKNQKHMDFIPGYHLIKLDELPDLFDKSQWKHGYIPLLSNYSSDLVCFSTDEGGIYLTLHDEPDEERLHKNKIDFVKTILELYQKKVYFLDEDGYLESDDGREDEIGILMNPDIEYWKD